jgi:hypothetical protein
MYVDAFFNTIAQVEKKSLCAQTRQWSNSGVDPADVCTGRPGVEVGILQDDFLLQTLSAL